MGAKYDRLSAAFLSKQRERGHTAGRQPQAYHPNRPGRSQQYPVSGGRQLQHGLAQTAGLRIVWVRELAGAGHRQRRQRGIRQQPV